MTHNISAKGFTLIETLVAIAIIMIAITGPFVATENSINAATMAHDKSIATFLAQEGVEYIHAIRDKIYIKECFSNNGVNCSGWWDIFTTNSSLFGTSYDVLQCVGTAPCALDITKSQYSSAPPFASGTLAFCAVGTVDIHGNGPCNPLYLTSSYMYTTSSASGNTPTIFSRKIVTTDLGSKAIKVKVTVTWKWYGGTQSITTTDILTSWE